MPEATVGIHCPLMFTTWASAALEGGPPRDQQVVGSVTLPWLKKYPRLAKISILLLRAAMIYVDLSITKWA